MWDGIGKLTVTKYRCVFLRRPPIKKDYSAGQVAQPRFQTHFNLSCRYLLRTNRKLAENNKSFYFQMTTQHSKDHLPEQYQREIPLELNYVRWFVNKEYTLQYSFEVLQSQSLIMHTLSANLILQYNKVIKYVFINLLLGLLLTWDLSLTRI